MQSHLLAFPLKFSLLLMIVTSWSSALSIISPAQSVYTQATELILSHYGGLSSVSRDLLVAKGQADLDVACSYEGEFCSYETAYEVIAQVVAALEDKHSFFAYPDEYRRFLLKLLEKTDRNLPQLTYVGNQDKIAILQIPTFLASIDVASRIYQDVQKSKLKQVHALIIDLRNNSGGKLSDCDRAVGAFVPQFERVVERKDSKQISTIYGNVVWDGPLVIIVNEKTASCSELFAYELQYAKRGIIIGKPTSGVGNTATLVFPLAGGAALHLTTMHYAKPDGTSYPERVLPDIFVGEENEQLKVSLDYVLTKQSVTEELLTTELLTKGRGE